MLKTENLGIESFGGGFTKMLFEAVAAGDLVMAVYAVRNGAQWSASDAQGRSVMHLAAAGGNAEVVRYLVSAGFGVLGADAAGRSPLHMARTPQVVEALVCAGAQPNVVDDSGRSPLHDACARGDAAVVRALLASGARADAQDLRGCTAMAGSQNVDCITALLQSGGGASQSFDSLGRAARVDLAQEGVAPVVNGLVLN